MKPKRSPIRRVLRIFGWCILAYLIVTGILVPTWTVLKTHWAIANALHNAKSVKLIHYNHHPGFISEKIYDTKELAPEDFHKVADAFPSCPDISLLAPFGLITGCLFDPHHRIVITDASGNVTIIRVCFECDHYQIGDDSPTQVTPYIWQYTLR